MQRMQNIVHRMRELVRSLNIPIAKCSCINCERAFTFISFLRHLITKTMITDFFLKISSTCLKLSYRIYSSLERTISVNEKKMFSDLFFIVKFFSWYINEVTSANLAIWFTVYFFLNLLCSIQRFVSIKLVVTPFCFVWDQTVPI